MVDDDKQLDSVKSQAVSDFFGDINPTEAPVAIDVNSGRTAKDKNFAETIFLANMELGYLTPPVGMNLYLASFRFEKPLMTVFRAALPFFLINLIAVLVITFVPAISVGVVQWFGM